MTRILAAIVAIACVYVGFEAFQFLATGPGSASEQVIFEVPGGKTFATVAQELEAKGLVRDQRKLRLLAKLTGQGSRVKRGEYALNRGMSPQQVMSVLVSGKSIQYPVTFPEGANMFEMAALVESKGLFKAADFLKLCRDKAVIQQLLGIEVSTLEGYLYPETYNVTKFTPLKELIASMVRNFQNTFSSLEAAGNKPPVQLNRHELVTLASVVEKETGAPEERPLIASVFYNRLQKNMRLQSDPTIIYGIWAETGKYKQNLTHDDIVRPTPYNTYTVPRLPFGPVSNPGREALAAVFKPSPSAYLYFVSRNNGTHIFTSTYEDHMKAVKAWQLDPAAREGKSWRDLNKTRTKATGGG